MDVNTLNDLLKPVVREQAVAASLQWDIIRLQKQLACPLASWEEQGRQVIEANVALVFVLKSVLEFLPTNLQPLLSQFLDLRAQVVLRDFEEEVSVNGAGIDHENEGGLHQC